ncbi:MAG: glycerate kinase family protein [Limisphaerales bacterium]
MPDKFKGTLPAAAAAEAIARGWHHGRPEDELELLPMTDGGDGFGEVMSRLLGGRPRQFGVLDAARRPRRARWWWASGQELAILESAEIIGLAILPPKRFHPFDLDTFGLGCALRAFSGLPGCILGLGGSATNDAGFGVARALGWEFLDRFGNPLVSWIDLHRLKEIRAPKRRKPLKNLILAVDVNNPLLGSNGATRIYGPQKGLRPRDVPQAERCLAQLARVVQAQLGDDCARVPGAGAAGGLGFGLAAFGGAKLKGGFELFARYARLQLRIGAADLVITGEGALDRSSLMGKGVGRVAEWCQKLHMPCFALAGNVSPEMKTMGGFARMHGLADFVGLRAAQSQPAEALERLTLSVARSLS